jgi:dCMP deaminase
MNHWDERFSALATMVATWSKDPSTKVGCVIVNDKRHIIATGYNGFPRGVEDSFDRFADRPTKYLMVQHAETNALHNTTSQTEGTTAYVTHFPCSNCAGALIQAGVKRVVTVQPTGGLADRFQDSFEASKVMFAEAGVEISV